MNRRSFFSTLAKAAAGFTILPPATTYQRIWRAARPPLEEYSCIITKWPEPRTLKSINWDCTLTTAFITMWQAEDVGAVTAELKRIDEDLHKTLL